jgi:hypothetical protein
MAVLDYKSAVVARDIYYICRYRKIVSFKK